MKKVLIVFIIFFVMTECFSQPHIIFDSVIGSQVTSHWKFHAGDDSRWANKVMDESGWLNIEPGKSLSQMPKEVLSEKGWYRIHFRIDTAARDTTLALLIDQYGASEIYIDGVLQKRVGDIISDHQYKLYNPHNQPLSVIVNSDVDHVIAARFFYKPPLFDRLYRIVDVPPFSLRIQYLSVGIAAREKQLRSTRLQIGFTSVRSVFAVLFILLYIFYPRQRLNLFFGLFNLIAVVHLYDNQFQDEGQYNLDWRGYLIYADGLLNRLIGMSLLMFILVALFNRINTFYRWFIFLTLCVDFPLSILFDTSADLIGYIIYIAVNIIWINLAVFAFRKGKKEDLLIGIIAISLVIGNGSFILFHFTGINFVIMGQVIGSVVITLCMVIYLALKYARDNTSLEHQFAQLKELSELTLLQEQEKQQMLALQNETLEKQVASRTAELKHSLDELKSTQAQLIQSEKMASLGQLTSGIAHEIQNPLNFVNNFSEVNGELIGELRNEEEKGKGEKEKGKSEMDSELLQDIYNNNEKIILHGKRADAIVKNMLEHSRQGTGEKQWTDINALANEYLTIAYNSMRAKDKFPITIVMKTEFDGNIGKMNIVAQDIGRVLLNLYNNAFYAVREKAISDEHGAVPGDAFEPEVKVTTKKNDGQVVISVKDNGKGIPKDNVGKIFQPFFTTKPTGEGTGLGLSLAYDMVKAHGGEINVETKEGEGATFIVLLPDTFIG